jgi:FkbM family methyltransferase
MNKLEDFKNIFDAITPWAGVVPRGYRVDFLGTLTDVALSGRMPGGDASTGGRFVQTALPVLDNVNTAKSPEALNMRGDGWFEVVNWFVAAAEARNAFVMVTLGAWHGGQAVRCYRALQRLNPMPAKLVAIEPMPEGMELTRRHFRDNGINPDDHWLIPMAVSDRNDPVFFAAGPRVMGSQNCYATNHPEARESYFKQLVEAGRAEQALHDLLLKNSTGLTIAGPVLADGAQAEAGIKLVGAITLNDVLGPFDRVDYLEADIQESEILVFPPFMDILKRKVRRVHIGTHGSDVHCALHDLFAREGWDIVFSYEPNRVYETGLGMLKTNDGVLTVTNPDR